MTVTRPFFIVALGVACFLCLVAEWFGWIASP